jgi:hypothetical protein
MAGGGLRGWRVDHRSSAAAGASGTALPGDQDASDASLPLPKMVATALQLRREQQDKARIEAGEAWQHVEGGPDLVFHFRRVAPLSFHDGRGRLDAADNRYSSWMARRHSASWGRLAQGRPAGLLSPFGKVCGDAGWWSPGSPCSAAYTSRRSASSGGRLSSHQRARDRSRSRARRTPWSGPSPVLVDWEQRTSPPAIQVRPAPACRS